MENANKCQVNDSKTLNKENLYSKEELVSHFRLHSELKKRAYEIVPLCTNINGHEEITGMWSDGETVEIGVWRHNCGNDMYEIPLEYFSMTTDEIEKSEQRKAELERKRQMEEEKREAARKRRSKERREHQKLNDHKDELANKFVCGLKPYRRVVIQDEQLSEWKSGGHGKAVHRSILGRVKAKIKSLPNARVLDAFIPTTKICLDCGAVQYMELKDRKFVCPCGVAEDRDVHAAKNMVRLYGMMRDFVGAERTEFKRVDFEEAYESRFHRDYEGCRRMKHEAAAYSAWR